MHLQLRETLGFPPFFPHPGTMNAMPPSPPFGWTIPPRPLIFSAMKKRPSNQTAPARKAPIHMTSLPQRERETLRLRLFALWEKGVPAAQAATGLNLRISTVKTNYARFETEGRDGAYEKPHGFALLTRSDPDRAAEEALVAAIAAGIPGDNAPGRSLWSADAVIDFFRVRFGRAISRTKAMGTLRRLGFARTVPVPSDRIKVFREWQEANLPEIRKLARSHHAHVAWVDETLAVPLSSNTLKHNRASALAPRCKTLSAMFLTGETFFRRLDGDLAPDAFRSFVQGLMAEQGNRPLVILMEDRRWLWSDEVAVWRKELRDAGRCWIRCYPRLHRPALVKSPKRPRAALEDILDALH